MRGAEVQWATDTADPATYFTLEAGRLDPEYQFFLSVHATARARLYLWTGPRGSTGTQRMVASFVASGPLHFPATGILGDRSALANLEVRVGSQVASAGRLVGYAVHPHPSNNPIHAFPTGASLTELQASTTIIGDTNAIASRIAGIPISPTTASGVALRDHLTPPDAHVGRHRVLAAVRSRLSGPVRLYGRDRYGGAIGPTALATQTDPAKLQIVDLGEVNVPGRASGQEAVPTQFVEIVAGGASGASVVATPGLHVAGLFYLNLDRSPGLLRTNPGAGQGLQNLYDDFRRFDGVRAYMEAFPNAQGGDGGVWDKVGSISYLGDYAPVVVSDYSAPGGIAHSTLASGLVQFSNVQTQLKVQVLPASNLGAGASAILPSALASGAFVEWRPKAQGATRSVRALLTAGPSSALSLSLLSHDGTATTLHASVGLGASAATAIAQGQALNLSARIVNGLADVWLATGAPAGSALISASHANFAMAGHPALRLRSVGTTGNSYANSLAVDDVSVSGLGASTGAAGAREWFRFESNPEERAIQGNASIFASDQTANFRGRPPRLPPIGSGAGASGPARVLVLQGEIDNFNLKDVVDVNLTALERFSFLR